ncbi:MAG: type II toxin-antitoxin system VapC family toxin [Salinivirgaceae bacterium]|jgi:PIN domain nuclease of toxin-antitoxin system
MNLLLDTHTFIWFFNGDIQLSLRAKKIIEDTKNAKFVSIASIWEVAIKIGVGKLHFDGNTSEVADLIEQNDFQILPIAVSHTVSYELLPLIHRDPFDRMLVAQANEEKLIIVTVDENIQKYEVKTIW